MVDHRRALGAAGEEQAARWYAGRGYQVLDRNWRCRAGELDLVVARGRLLVVVEVKTRRTDRFGTPAEAVTVAKQRRLRQLTVQYMEATGARPATIRFDVAAVLAGRLDVIEGAFLAVGHLNRTRPRPRPTGRPAALRPPSRRRPGGSCVAGGTG